MSNLSDEQGNKVKIKDKRASQVKEDPIEQEMLVQETAQDQETTDPAPTSIQEPESDNLNPVDMARIEAMETNLPFAACRKCDKSRICPIPSNQNAGMFAPNPHQCWIENMKKDAQGRQVIAKMLATMQNKYGLLMYELDSIEDTIELLTNALNDSGRISLHGSGALESLKRKYRRGQR